MNDPAFSNGWLGVVLFSRVVVSVRYIFPNVLLKNESNESKSNELFIKDPSIAAILMVMVYAYTAITHHSRGARGREADNACGRQNISEMRQIFNEVRPCWFTSSSSWRIHLTSSFEFRVGI